MKSKKIKVTLANGNVILAEHRDIAVGNLFSSPKGEEVLTGWLLDEVTKTAKDTNTLWEQQGIRKFVASIQAAVNLVRQIKEKH